MKGGVSPFNVVLRKSKTLSIAVTMPKRYIAYVIMSAFPTPKQDTIPPATAVNIGSFAPQEKRNHPYCGNTFFAVGKSASVYHGGYRTTEAHYHRHKCPARQSETTENSVKNKGNACHVTAVFQNGKKQKQHQNGRKEGKNGSKSVNYATVDQSYCPRLHSRVFHRHRICPNTLPPTCRSKCCSVPRRANTPLRHKCRQATLHRNLSVRLRGEQSQFLQRRQVKKGRQKQKIFTERKVKHGKQYYEKDGNSQILCVSTLSALSEAVS